MAFSVPSKEGCMDRHDLQGLLFDADNLMPAANGGRA